MEEENWKKEWLKKAEKPKLKKLPTFASKVRLTKAGNLSVTVIIPINYLKKVLVGGKE